MCICSFLSCLLNCVNRAHMANIFLWTAGILCGISVVAPFWMSTLPVSGAGCYRTDFGILFTCCAVKDCTWIWQHDSQLQKDTPDSFRWIQYLFLSGCVLLLLVLLMSPFRFCCCPCSRKSVALSRVFGVFTFISACLLGAAVVYFFYLLIFGANSIFLLTYTVTKWSFAYRIGFAGVCFTLASSVFWFLDGSRQVGSITIENDNQQNV